MKEGTRRWWHALRAPMLTPAGLALRAVWLLVFFAVAHRAGLREYTGVISLTWPEGASRDLACLYAATYCLLYFSAVLLAPILLLAAGILAGLQRLAGVTSR